MVIDTNLERMYHAGKHDIPIAADRLAAIANRLYDHLQTFNQQAALAGDPALLRSMLEVGGDLYDVLRGGVASLNNCASALIKTADEFVRTDEDAQEAYRTMDRTLKDAPLPVDAGEPPPLANPEERGATVSGEDGSTTTRSTPDPVDPAADAEQRQENEESSEFEHEREKRRG